MVTLADVRAVRYCHKGTRRAFLGRGWSWADFLTHGLPASLLAATGDAMLLKLVAAAEERHGLIRRG